MLIGQIIILMIIWIAMVSAIFHTHVRAQKVLGMSQGAQVGPTSIPLAAMVATLIATRSLAFGVDTIADAQLFTSYCHGGDISTLELSYQVLLQILNIAMVGACNTELLPLAWILLALAGVASIDARREVKFIYLGMLFASLIGIELSTNALRQSLSVVLTVVALSHWKRHPWLSLIAAGASVAFHSSAALVLLALALSALDWPLFMASATAVAAVLIISLQQTTPVVLLAPLLYEITKYLGHEGDEVLVRVLAAACVVVALITPLLAAQTAKVRAAIVSDASFAWAVKLAATCLPFLVLPYFGYRYIYGVFPLVLWLVLDATETRKQIVGRAFACMLSGQAAVLLARTLGSTYMRTVPFYG